MGDEDGFEDVDDQRDGDFDDNYDPLDDEPDDFFDDDYNEDIDDEVDDVEAYDYVAGFPGGRANFNAPPEINIEVVEDMTPEKAAELLLKQAPAEVQLKLGFKFSPERCRYGFLGPRGAFRMAHTACVAAISNPGINNPVGIINWLWDAPLEIVEYVFGAESPWKNITKDVKTHIGADGVHAVVITDLSHSGQALASFMKAFRGFTEAPGFGAVSKALVEAGVHPGIALFYGQYYSMNTPGKPLRAQQGGWHGSFINCYGGVKTLQNFLAGVYVDNERPWTEYKGYHGCDGIFEVKEEQLTKYLKRKYPELHEITKTQTKFAGVIETGGLTIENLIKIAIMEEPEFIDVDR